MYELNPKRAPPGTELLAGRHVDTASQQLGGYHLRATPMLVHQGLEPFWRYKPNDCVSENLWLHTGSLNHYYQYVTIRNGTSGHLDHFDALAC